MNFINNIFKIAPPQTSSGYERVWIKLEDGPMEMGGVVGKINQLPDDNSFIPEIKECFLNHQGAPIVYDGANLQFFSDEETLVLPDVPTGMHYFTVVDGILFFAKKHNDEWIICSLDITSEGASPQAVEAIPPLDSLMGLGSGGNGDLYACYGGDDPQLGQYSRNGDEEIWETAPIASVEGPILSMTVLTETTANGAEDIAYVLDGHHIHRIPAGEPDQGSIAAPLGTPSGGKLLGVSQADSQFNQHSNYLYFLDQEANELECFFLSGCTYDHICRAKVSLEGTIHRIHAYNAETGRLFYTKVGQPKMLYWQNPIPGNWLHIDGAGGEATLLPNKYYLFDHVGASNPTTIHMKTTSTEENLSKQYFQYKAASNQPHALEYFASASLPGHADPLPVGHLAHTNPDTIDGLRINLRLDDDGVVIVGTVDMDP